MDAETYKVGCLLPLGSAEGGPGARPTGVRLGLFLAAFLGCGGPLPGSVRVSERYGFSHGSRRNRPGGTG